MGVLKIAIFAFALLAVVSESLSGTKDQDDLSFRQYEEEIEEDVEDSNVRDGGINFVYFDFFEDSLKHPDTHDNGEGIAPRAGADSTTPTPRSSNSDVILTYPAYLIDVPPDPSVFIRFPGGITNVTEPPEIEDPEDTTTEQISNERCKSIGPIIKEGKRVSEIKCEEYQWHIYNAIICRSEDGDNTGIAGGKMSPQGSFPHMGAVGWQKEPIEDNIYDFLCGSSLISLKYALTAAHCTISEDEQKKLKYTKTTPEIVRLGTVYLVNKKKSSYLDFHIEKFIQHDLYKSPKKYNDIALIKLEKEVKILKTIRPACLGIGDLINTHQVANISGWGKTEKGVQSNNLKFAEVPIIKSRECRNVNNRYQMRHWPDGILDSQFCAGNISGGVDTCVGDSGGPIQIHKPHMKNENFTMSYVLGVTSFGPGEDCAQADKLGIYTNVTNYLCWIEKQVWPGEKNNCATN